NRIFSCSFKSMSSVIIAPDLNLPAVPGRATSSKDGEVTVSLPPKISPQRFVNGEIHDWYRTVHGFSDHLVAMLLDRFQIKPGQKVLDAFCGTGTTVVECMKRTVASVGIDASPLSCFVSAVKANWTLRPQHLLGLLREA